MINAWEYAYDNYDGENEDSVVDSIVENFMEEICDACDADKMVDKKVEERLEDAIRDFVLDTVNFNEIKYQMENDRDEYYERERTRRGEY